MNRCWAMKKLISEELKDLVIFQSNVGQEFFSTSVRTY